MLTKQIEKIIEDYKKKSKMLTPFFVSKELAEFIAKKLEIDIEKCKDEVFGIMLEKHEYRQLSDYYVKEILSKVLAKANLIKIKEK